MENITINPSVTSVGIGTFSHCSNLKTVKIKNGINNLTFGAGAFSYTTSLTDVYYAGSSSNWDNYVSIDNASSGNQTLINATKHWNSK